MKTIVQQFDRAASTYDDHSSIQRQVANTLAQELSASPHPECIFEIGCGTGHLTRELVQRFPESKILATDASQAMVNLAEKNIINENLKLRTWVAGSDLIGLPERSDLIVSSMVFQWLPDWMNLAKLLAERSTQLAFSLPIEGTFDNWIGAHREAGLKPGVMDFSSEDEIRQWLKQLPNDLVGQFSRADCYLEFDTPFAFVKSLRAVGADSPIEDHSPVNLKRIFAKFPDGIQIRYSIAYLFIQRKT